MRQQSRAVGLFFPLAFLLLWAKASFAGESRTPADEADELIRQGIELRQQGRNPEALEVFQRAAARAPSARALAQIGSVEFALHRWLDAEVHLSQCLSLHDSAWIEHPKNRELLERTLADTRRQIARIQLRGTTDAEVSIDGKVVGVLPIADPTRVIAGTIRIAASAPGHRLLNKTLTVVGGEEVTINIELERIELAPSAPQNRISIPLTARSEAPKGHRQAWRKWTGGILFLSGLGAVGTGVTWVLVDGRPICKAPIGGVCDALLDTKTRGWIVMAAGAAAVGVGIGLVLWPIGNEVVVGFGPRSLGMTGTF